jgi:hypothetical protein
MMYRNFSPQCVNFLDQYIARNFNLKNTSSFLKIIIRRQISISTKEAST